MTGLTSKTRLALVAGYLGLILLGVAALSVMYAGIHPVVRITVIWFHSLPLLLTKFLEVGLFGGPDPEGRGGLFFVLIVAIQWWPLAVLSLLPRLWAPPLMRRLTLGYLAALLLCGIAAAVWLTMDPSLLAS